MYKILQEKTVFFFTLRNQDLNIKWVFMKCMVFIRKRPILAKWHHGFSKRFFLFTKLIFKFMFFSSFMPFTRCRLPSFEITRIFTLCAEWKSEQKRDVLTFYIWLSVMRRVESIFIYIFMCVWVFGYLRSRVRYVVGLCDVMWCIYTQQAVKQVN
jgi:hypothetical protein